MNIENEQNCSIKDSVIKQGTYLARDGSLKLEFEERLKRAHQAVGMLKNIWNHSNFSVHTKIKIYKVMVSSILIYRHESWYSTVMTDNKLFAF